MPPQQPSLSQLIQKIVITVVILLLIGLIATVAQYVITAFKAGMVTVLSVAVLAFVRDTASQLRLIMPNSLAQTARFTHLVAINITAVYLSLTTFS